MNNQNKKLCLNRFRQISEDIFGANSISRFLSTVPHLDEVNQLTPKTVGELITEANKQAEQDLLPDSWKKKYKKFAGKLSLYQHEPLHGAR